MDDSRPSQVKDAICLPSAGDARKVMVDRSAMVHRCASIDLGSLKGGAGIVQVSTAIKSTDFSTHPGNFARGRPVCKLRRQKKVGQRDHNTLFRTIVQEDGSLCLSYHTKSLAAVSGGQMHK